MLFVRRIARRLIRRRTAAAIVALLGQLAATFGLPMPAFAANRHDTSTPYPCMNHSCGCLSAEECWRSCCCCYTNAEKVAWAAANGVDLPEFVREAAVFEGGECHPEPVDECPACAAHRHHDEPRSVETASPVRWSLGPAAARCHGGPVALFQTAPAQIPSGPSVLKFTPVLAGTLIPFDLSATRLTAPPLGPPPRAG